MGPDEAANLVDLLLFQETANICKDGLSWTFHEGEVGVDSKLRVFFFIPEKA